MLSIVMNFLCVVPVYNEEEKLQQLCYEIHQFKLTNSNIEFLIINNGSSDRSGKIIKNSKLLYKSNKKNMGVGYALIQGFYFAQKNRYDVLIHLAGNGKMKPREIKKFMNKINKENYDFVNGSRFIKGGDYNNNPKIRIIMIKVLTFIISFLYNRKITDATCGFRAFKLNTLSKLIHHVDNQKYYTYRYEYFTLGKILLNKKVKFTEIGVIMDYKKKNYSKIRPIIDWAPIVFGWLEAFFDKRNF